MRDFEAKISGMNI